MARIKHGIILRICVLIVTVLLIHTQVLKQSHLREMGKRELLVSTEIPAEHIDPTSIDLTGLVNTLINASRPGCQHLFSLLSVTSHSSLALHKLTLLVYNISNFQDIESSLFPLRYCYCVTNRTNDLTGFTAVLLDVMGNSTSYLQELFKSSSILSVSQKNSSECIYICVMAGKTDSDLSKLWDVSSVTPLFNKTITEVIPKGNMTFPFLPFGWHDLPNSSDLVEWPKTSTDFDRNRVSSRNLPTTDATTTSTPIVALTTTVTLTSTETFTTTTSTAAAKKKDSAPTKPTGYTSAPMANTSILLAFLRLTTGTSTKRSQELTKASRPDKPGCPWRNELLHHGTEKESLNESSEEKQLLSRVSISTGKLQPCVFELCKFYSQCVCRGFSHRAAATPRYCKDSHRWYERHTTEVCSRMRRVALSKNLKQKCLARMCVKM
ncbi:hypothetical protein DNTS_023023 [Danionella cerebrum]|uniref:HERV-H LTR-associating protein 1 n=1 Tax=Danionella cerebrum TaxID=2873325 RepID=A0A553QLY9_9TELE|nr:hypothetical protein DNTS_023023 [Danionella translucida]